MSFDLRDGIVRILKPNGEIAGTGFVLTIDGLIATCSHVVQSNEAQKRGERRPEKVTIVFHTAGESREAQIEPNWWYSSYKDKDVAILRVSGCLPKEAKSLPLGSSKGISNHSFDTFGFPKSNLEGGIWGDGHILGETEIQGVLVRQLRSGQVTPGFSGAPVVDRLRRRVVGMVNSIIRPDEYGRLAETAFITPIETLRDVCLALKISDVCPYRNLAAFTEADATFFRGRERVIEMFIDNLQNEPRFLAVFGASGSGKSSIVQAGLIPQLRDSALPGSDRWDIIVTRPTDATFKQHLVHLDQASASTALVIDQFEEFFVSYGEMATLEVMTQLTHLLEHSPHITLLIVMRDDFYSLLMQQETLAMWLKGRVVNVWSTLKREEIEAIVREPAELLGWQFEEGLVGKIIDDVLATSVQERKKNGSSTILPLLEFTLTQLWERHQDGILTHEVYHRIGGITGGLKQWANDAYYTFEERLRPLVRQIFTELVHLGDEERHIADSRRRRSLSTLIHSDAERTDISQIVQQLVADRLLVTSRDQKSRQETIEIIHEALLWEWSLLKGWVQEDRTFLHWHQKIEEQTQEWVATNIDHSTKREAGKLLRGSDLEMAKDWLTKRKADLSLQEQGFIKASSMRRRWFALSTAVILFILISTMGLAIWLVLRLPPSSTLVTTLQDNNEPGSLRYAVNQAPPKSTITFDTSLHGTILLSSGDLNIAKDLIIRGPGAGILAISSSNNGYAVNVSQGVSVTISGFTFQNSHLRKSFLSNQGTLQLINSTVLHNMVDMPSSGGGGGVTNSGMLTLINSTVSGNRVLHPASEGFVDDGGGGGIYNYNLGKLTLINSTVSGNSVFGGGVVGGGGIYNRSGTLMVANSTVSGNIAESGDGGGIYSDSGSLTLVNSTISGNVVNEGSGGGIESRYTLVGFFPNMTIVFCTIYDNTAQNGGGIADGDNADFDHLYDISSSIIAGNHAGMHANVDGRLLSGGYNLIQDISEVAVTSYRRNYLDRSIDNHGLTALFGAHPKLQNNGGSTQTLALLQGSSAIDVVPWQVCRSTVTDDSGHDVPITTDQRGDPRPDGSENSCDIGAYESSR